MTTRKQMERLIYNQRCEIRRLVEACKNNIEPYRSAISRLEALIELKRVEIEHQGAIIDEKNRRIEQLEELVC